MMERLKITEKYEKCCYRELAENLHLCNCISNVNPSGDGSMKPTCLIFTNFIFVFLIIF